MSESKRSDDVPPASEQAVGRGIPLSDEAAVAMAAVLHLLRLVSAELILFRGLDAPRLENAMREKIGEFTSPVANQEAKEAGLAFARSLVDQILVHVRAQAELKNTLAGKANSNIPPPSPSPLLH
jgi:fumarylacetoacetate (FAA) hydrolase family protein